MEIWQYVLWMVRDGSIILKPANEKYPEIEIMEGMDFKMWGVVTYIIKKV